MDIANRSVQVESVQPKFLKYASFINLGIQCPPHDYFPISKILDLQTLADREWMLSHTFSRCLDVSLSNVVDSPTLLSLITYKVPQFRASVSSYIPQYKGNDVQNEPLKRIMSITNEYPSLND